MEIIFVSNKEKNMNKTEFIKELSKKTKLTQKECGHCLNAISNILAKTLQKGEDIQFVGFGKFGVKYRNERMSFNPQTKTNIRIPASKTPSFKAGKYLKEAIY